MTPINRKKSKSITVSHFLISKIQIYISNGQFSTVTDFVNTAIAKFLGKIELLNSIDNSTTDLLNVYFESAITQVINDSTDKENFSISFNSYTNEELEKLTYIFNNNRSFVVRIAIYDFINSFNNRSPNQIKISNSKTMPETPEELEKFIIKTFEKIDRK